MKKLRFRSIDLNMGCPVQNVAADIIQAAKIGGLPVSVKIRLGYTNVYEWLDWLGHVLKQDIANLSIHLRTKKR